MARPEASRRAARFDRLYLRDRDPWGFRTSVYEAAKYQATLASLPRRRYRQGIEVGCSIGELTRRLSSRCDRLLGLDVSAIAIDEARRRWGRLPNVRFAVAEMPGHWPDVAPDLIVLSEVLYFLDEDEVVELARLVAASWVEAGDCVLVNYLGPTDESLGGEEAGSLFIEALAQLRPTTILKSDRRESYRLDVLRARSDGGRVA